MACADNAFVERPWALFWLDGGFVGLGAWGEMLMTLVNISDSHVH